MQEPTEILPGLYQSNWPGLPGMAQWIQTYGIGAVLDAAIELPRFPGGAVETWKLPWYDTNDQIFPALIDTFNWIWRQLSLGKRVLVHCYAGRSRSSAVTCFFIMKSQGIGFRSAYRQLKQRRPQVHMNSHYQRQLQAYATEHELPDLPDLFLSF